VLSGLLGFVRRKAASVNTKRIQFIPIQEFVRPIARGKQFE
jgi:hypothetical protein